MLHGMPEFNTIALENLGLQKGLTAFNERETTDGLSLS